MGVTTTIRAPKGHVGMTLFGTHNDDATVVLPDIGFDFFYGGVNRRSTIQVCGNSWLGFSASTSELKISSSDNSYNSLYYINEIENGVNVFRIRFEGNYAYSSWGSNNLVWELILYNNNCMVLVIEATTKQAADAFDTKGGSGVANWAAASSYSFFTTQSNGTAYVITTGSYVQRVTKFLIDDGIDGIKHFNGTTWVKVGDLPLTEDMFRAFGDDNLTTSRNGLILDAPTLHYWSESAGDALHQLKQVIVQKPKLIKQIVDYNITTGVKSVAYVVTATGTSLIRPIVSVDSGVTWYTWNGTSWIVIDSTNLAAIAASTITSSSINTITSANWNLLVGTSKVIRFGWLLKQVVSTESCNVNYIMVNYL